MALSLGSPFGNHMVLQAGRPVPVWGWASPGARVAVAFAGQQVTTTADAKGAWSLTLGPLEVSTQGREFTVTASSASGSQGLTFKDVLVGEVWLCSGQSNMQWTVEQIGCAQTEGQQANDPLLRVLTANRTVSDTPLDKLASPASWELSGPDTVGAFTAAGYYFGKELRRRLKVPVGLIHCSWGGTMIETWISREGLFSTETGSRIRKDFEDHPEELDAAQARWEQAIEAINQQHHDAENRGHAQGWAGADEPADVAWRDMNVPAIWQNQGWDFHGVVWFRREVELPADWAGRELSLELGAADKSDDTYFNNVHVGSLKYEDDRLSWSKPRQYTVPGHLVKAGKNVVAVRVRSYLYAGGLMGPAKKMLITCPSLPDQPPVLLAGPWRAAVEADYGLVVPPPAPPGRTMPNAPSRLYNAMIRPMQPFALRGVVWYQGESNAERHHEYAELFQSLIQDMRRLWNDPQQAFHFVQLANFRPRNEQPVDSTWARLREAQTQALTLPHTGMAVTIDIGHDTNIHPDNKQDVGARLAYNALHQTYGMKQVVPCGPLFRQAVVKEDSIELHFDHADSGLELRCKDEPAGFAIAGEDMRFVWAEAQVQGQALRVSSSQVARPMYVRYGWGDNPPVSLYSRAGLPASPFRTDEGKWEQ